MPLLRRSRYSSPNPDGRASAAQRQRTSTPDALSAAEEAALAETAAATSTLPAEKHRRVSKFDAEFEHKAAAAISQQPSPAAAVADAGPSSASAMTVEQAVELISVSSKLKEGALKGCKQAGKQNSRDFASYLVVYAETLVERMTMASSLTLCSEHAEVYRARRPPAPPSAGPLPATLDQLQKELNAREPSLIVQIPAELVNRVSTLMRDRETRGRESMTEKCALYTYLGTDYFRELNVALREGRHAQWCSHLATLRSAIEHLPPPMFQVHYGGVPNSF